MPWWFTPVVAERTPDAVDQADHPRRNRSERCRAQSRKFRDLSLRQSDRKDANLTWAESMCIESLKHDFTNAAAWLEYALVLESFDGSRTVKELLEELLVVLGRSSEPMAVLEAAGVDTTLDPEVIRSLLRTDPLEPVEWWNQISNSSTAQEDIDAFARRCSSLDLQDQRANILFGRRLEYLRLAGHDELFVRLAEHLLALRPVNHELWVRLGQHHEHKRDMGDAWLAYDQAQRLRPRHRWADRFKARAETSLLDVKAPTDEDASRMFRRLETLRHSDESASASKSTPVEPPENSTWEDEAVAELESLFAQNNLASAYLKARRHHLMGHEWAEPYLLRAESSLIEEDVVDDAFEAEEG